MDLLLAFLFYQGGLPSINHLAESYSYFFLYYSAVWFFSLFCYVLIYCDPSSLYEVFKRATSPKTSMEI